MGVGRGDAARKRVAPCCKNSRGTCSQACTIEGEHCEHCTLTFRARHPSATAAMGFRKSGTAPDRPGQASVLRAIANGAGGISGRGQGSRLQASGGSLLHAALAPGAAPALTKLSRRGLHSGRRAVLARGARPAGGLLDFAQPGSCFLFSYHEPSGKPAAPNGHTRTASLNPLSGTAPLGGQ